MCNLFKKDVIAVRFVRKNIQIDEKSKILLLTLKKNISKLLNKKKVG